MRKLRLVELACIVLAFCVATAVASHAQSLTTLHTGTYEITAVHAHTTASPAQTFTTLHSFDGTDGVFPEYTPPVQGTDGNLYGTTEAGGANSAGTVFKITPSGTLTTLYSFCSQSGCADGADPYAGLVLATDGNFYGVTVGYGGTVFEITPSGTLTTLLSFNGTDGSEPWAALVLGTDGNFYGTTLYGGTYGWGTVFEITPSGTLTTLLSFDLTDGGEPYGGALIQATDGNFYGVTAVGGANSCLFSGKDLGCGTVFKITPGGTLTTLYSFCSQSGCSDGQYPEGGLIQATDGNFYGTSSIGGANGAGTIFKITASGTLTTLYSFCSQSGCTDGGYPQAGLIQATDGNFYGTTYGDGANGAGTIFKISPGGTLTTLYSFCSQSGCADGADPIAGLMQATNGEFYGTTFVGGAYSDGTVFSLSVGLGLFVKTVPTFGNVGTAVEILGTNLTGATSVSFNGTAATFEVASPSEITTTVPPGATTGYVTVATPGGTLTSNVPFQVGTGTLTPTTTTLTSSPNPSTYGQSVTFTATVTPQGSGTPTGTVTFTYGSTTLCNTVTLSGGNAACTYSALPAGSDIVTATYSGDANFAGSSGTLTQVVQTSAGPAWIPVFSPMPSTYTSPVTITISEKMSGTTIYYTTDGTPPTTGSNVYSGPIKLTATTTFNAMATGGGYSQSPTATATYTLQAMTPGFSPLPSTYNPPKTVTINEGTSGATVYYTTDGSTPSATNGTVYTGPFTLSQTTTVKAIAIGTGYNPSAVATGVYTMQALTPSFSPLPSTYSTPLTVSILEGTAGATIYYTTDGSTPSATNGTVYTGPFTLSQTTTVKAIAIGTGYNPSAVATGTYTIS